MSAVKELIRVEDNGSISFGDYELTQKTKLSDFEYEGDVYKVKTFDQITKFEKNGLFVYESVPGTAVKGLMITEEGMQFGVEGHESAQVTVEMEPDAQYHVSLNGMDVGNMNTHLGGKLSFSVEFENGSEVVVVIQKV